MMTDIALNYVSNVSHRPGQLGTAKLSMLHVNVKTILLLSRSPHFKLNEKL